MIKPCFEVVLELDSLNQEFELITDIDDDFIIYAVEEENENILLDISSEDEEYLLEIQDNDALDYILESSTAIINYIDGEIYSGDYTVTPTRQPQVLLTSNKVLLENITVEAIPSCYGLVEWNGSVMRIS